MNLVRHFARNGFTIAAVMAVGGSVACKGTETAKSATTPNAMIVGPENIAVVKAEQIRSGPAISGTLQPEQQATVRAEVGGTVLQALVEQGTRVHKGQLLARIDDAALREGELSARAAVTTAQSSVDLNKRQVERNEALLKAGAIAERDVEIARNQYSAAEAQLANAKALLANAMKQLSKSTIEAPFSGIVSARTVSAGDVVQSGAALYTIVNPSTMRLEASVPADQLSAVRFGIPVDFTVSGYPTRHFTGRITNINPVADPATRQVRIIVSLPNENGVLVGGLFADGHVASEVRTAPVLPMAAVDERGLRPFVMRIKSGVVQKAEVELGIRDAATETVEVRSGVQPGDTILLGAARGISEKTPVKVSAVAADTGRKP
ncbi:MAG TPA: efflux RND transporter periplasmic adaptor subunit [Gemmatimonadaceae bacterium]|nr:efflux RND transporter periplasmic adaptor subunit [Gemmatimonadaceae bacterium]